MKLLGAKSSASLQTFPAFGCPVSLLFVAERTNSVSELLAWVMRLLLILEVVGSSVDANSGALPRALVGGEPLWGYDGGNSKLLVRFEPLV